jgi:hypothetical protein
MSGNYKQQKKQEKNRNSSPYDSRNSKKLKNNTTSLATEIANITQTRDVTNNNINNKQNASISNNISPNNMDIEVETSTANEPQPETENPNVDQFQHHNNQTIPDHLEEDWNQVAFRKRHTIFVDAEDCKGETQREKRLYLEEEIENIAHLLGISTRKIGEAHVIKIDLTFAEDKIATCQILEDLHINYRTSFKDKEAETENLENPKRSTELVVKDIPLGTTKDAIGKRFSL